jgi:serine/threonine protein kinase
MLGNVIGGRYKILSPLGSGGFGETYIAEDLQLPDRARCVVKRLKPSSKDSFILHTARRLFETEAKVLHRLGKHNQIPQLLAHFEENREFYLVQELVDGQDLAQELGIAKSTNAGTFRSAIKTESEVLDFLEDLLQILEFVHQQDVIHRDIKPANLLRRKSDRKLVLIDFGAVKQIYTQLPTASEQGLEPTNMTVAVGTVGYMPNEQANGKPRLCSDIYAVGTIAIQQLLGIPPNQIPEDPATSEIAWRQSPTDAKIQYCAEVSSALAEILDKMVRYDFRQRYQSASEALADVRKLRLHAASTMLNALSLDERPIAPSQLPTQTVQPRLLESNPNLANPDREIPPAPTVVSESSDRQNFRAENNSGSKFWIGVGVSSLLVSAGAIAFTQIQPKPSQRTVVTNPEIQPEPTKSPAQTSSPAPTVTPTLTPTTPSPRPTIPKNNIPTSTTPRFTFLSERPVTEADFKGKSMEELDIMRNEVFARYGRRFRDAEFQAFFDAQPWYKPRYAPEDFPSNILTPIERQNVKEIANFQQRSLQGQVAVAPTSCPAPKRVIEDLDPPINVRMGPGINFQAIGKLNNGVEVTVINEKNGWLRISEPISGWIASNRTALVCPKS